MEFPESYILNYNIYFPINNYKYLEKLRNELKEVNFEHKYRRLVDFLLKTNENIKTANELIDKKDLSKLNEVIEKLQNGNNTLIETITGGRLKDEKLMEYTLGTTEDINKTLSREEDLKSGCEISKFISYFENNKICLKNSLLNSENIDNEINKLYKNSYDNDNELDKEISASKDNLEDNNKFNQNKNNFMSNYNANQNNNIN